MGVSMLVIIIYGIGCVFSYNIDTSYPVIFEQKVNELYFGYTSAFVANKDQLKIVIGSPGKPTSTAPGNIFICDVDDPLSCVSSYSPDESRYTTDALKYEVKGIYSNTSEGFGTVIQPLTDNEFLVCSPRWKIPDNEQNEAFLYGRCRVVNLTTNSKGIGSDDYFSREDHLFVNSGSVFYKYGMEQFGFSSDKISDSRFILGAPGMYEWTGGLFLVDTVEASLTYTRFEPEIDQSRFNSYIGYDISYGNLCKSNRICFTVGSPRYADQGKVDMYEYVNGKFIMLDTLYADDTMVGSYFGSVLASADIDNDGWDDILVGARTFTDNTKKATSFSNEGRVYVYKNLAIAQQGSINFKRNPAILTGSNKAFAMFGSAISKLGDINGDSIDDIAVGAPNEDEGVGAIYIYNGGYGGINDVFSQRISGKDIRQNFKGFGNHISKPHDVNGDQYPDIAVSSLYSANVVILKSRPIVDITANMTFDTDQISLSKTGCPTNINDVESCFTVNICLQYDGDSLPKSISINYTLAVDINTRPKRARVHNAVDVSKVLDLIHQQESCESIQVITFGLPRKDNPFSPVSVLLTYEMLSESVNTSNLQPIVNRIRPKNITKDIIFELPCGDDKLCNVDLSLESQVVFLNQEQKFIVVNQTEQIHLNTLVSNTNEESFGTSVRIVWNNRFEYKRVITAVEKPISCTLEAQATAESSIICKIFEPIPENGRVNFTVVLDSSDLSLDNGSVRFNLNTSTNTFSSDENIKNNQANLTSNIWIKAKPEILGSATPPDVSVVMDKDLDGQNFTLTHKYRVVNQGPSYLPSTELFLDIPGFYRTGEQLTNNVTAKYLINDNTYDVICVRSSTSLPGGITTTSSPTADISPASTATTRTSTNIPTREPRPTRYPTREENRRKRDVQEETETKPKDDKKKTHQMSCENYVCIRLVCDINQPLQPGDNIIVNVDFSINAADLPLKDYDKLEYMSITTLKQPDHPLFYPWNDKQMGTISTTIYKEYLTRGNVPWWIILVSIISSLVLLIIIGIVLKKCGFFKRQKKDDLKKKKRESGYYGSQRGGAQKRGSEKRE